MSGRLTTCSKCGSRARGNFCPTCGAPLDPDPDTDVGSREQAGRWIIVVAVALILIGVAFMLGRASSGGGGAAPAARTTDLSGLGPQSLTPRDAANRLFDRVMTYAEQGFADSVQFFKPMALQAYQMLGGYDNDARFDVGMILAVSGEPEAALAQADSLETAVPGHLLAQVLRHTVAEARSDTRAATAAQRRFLAAYEAEIVIERPEYVAHRSMLEGFREQARAAVGTGG